MAFTLPHPVHHELVIKKSRFIACVQPVEGRAEAQAIVQQLWQQHPGAAHVCWALLAGGQSAAVDDGEPSGTAGRPMLDVLRHQELEGVLATVVRYFGGVKLGAGGLVRAYTDAVAQALLDAPKVARERQTTLVCQVPYAQEGWLRRELQAVQAQLLDVSHADEVTLRWRLPEPLAAGLVERLNEGGQGKLRWLKEDSAAVD
ncbi:IMPACT family protein [Hydrogenophaga aquatica]